ncbi:MAG: hypothetical protein ACTHPS_29020 [Streptosporangiaceae bacterium]
MGRGSGGDQRFNMLADADTPVKTGEQVRFGLEPGRLYLFDAMTQQALGMV